MRHGGRARAVLALLLGLGVLLGLPSTAHAAGGERIVSFTADYAVQTNGSMDVTETLVWQFAGNTSHGIQRYIRTSAGYDQKPDTYRRYEMSDVSASSPSGAPLGRRGVRDRRGDADPHRQPRPDGAGPADVRGALPPRARGQRLRGPQRALLERHRAAGRHPHRRGAGHRPRPRRGDAGGLLLRRPGLHRHLRGAAGRPGDGSPPGPRPGRAGERGRVVPAGCGHRRRPRPAPGRDGLLR